MIGIGIILIVILLIAGAVIMGAREDKNKK
jgi:hypothetical protein